MPCAAILAASDIARANIMMFVRLFDHVRKYAIDRGIDRGIASIARDDGSFVRSFNCAQQYPGRG